MAKGKYEYWLTDEGLLLLEGWAKAGLVDEQIAHNMGISVRTLTRWKNVHCPICQALKKNKAVADFEVENALFKRAIGYDVVETTQERMLNKETGEYELVTTKEVHKHIVPDTTAQIFWLKNRKPDEWRDRRDIGIDGTINTEPSSLSDDELDKKIADLKKTLGVADEEAK